MLMANIESVATGAVDGALVGTGIAPFGYPRPLLAPYPYYGAPSLLGL